MKNDEKFFKRFLMPTIHTVFDAETAHKIAIEACKFKSLLPMVDYNDPETLVISKKLTTF